MESHPEIEFFATGDEAQLKAINDVFSNEHKMDMLKAGNHHTGHKSRGERSLLFWDPLIFPSFLWIHAIALELSPFLGPY